MCITDDFIIFDPFYLFLWPWLISKAKYLYVWKVICPDNSVALNLGDDLSASLSQLLWEWVPSRTCRYWEQEQSTSSLCCRLSPGWNFWLAKQKCVNTESWLWRPLHSDLRQIYLSTPLLEAQWLHQIQINVLLFMLSLSPLEQFPGVEFNV